MYENTIKTLECHVGNVCNSDQLDDALNTAIALMRKVGMTGAAERLGKCPRCGFPGCRCRRLKAAGVPEVAEREYCRARASYWVGRLSAEQADLEDALYEERSAVRAEMQQELNNMRDAYERRMQAAKDEIEKLRKALEGKT